MLRTHFNSGRFYERMQRGELTPLVLHSSPRTLADGEPVASQTVAYLDHLGTKVAVVHQYIRPDGSVAASGLPDPKDLVVDGMEYTWNGG